MRINHFPRAREPNSIDQACMIQFIRKNRILAAHQRTQQSHIRSVPAAELQRRFAAHELSELALHFIPRDRVSRKRQGSRATHTRRLSFFKQKPAYEM